MKKLIIFVSFVIVGSATIFLLMEEKDIISNQEEISQPISHENLNNEAIKTETAFGLPVDYAQERIAKNPSEFL